MSESSEMGYPPIENKLVSNTPDLEDQNPEPFQNQSGGLPEAAEPSDAPNSETLSLDLIAQKQVNPSELKYEPMNVRGSGIGRIEGTNIIVRENPRLNQAEIPFDEKKQKAERADQEFKRFRKNGAHVPKYVIEEIVIDDKTEIRTFTEEIRGSSLNNVNRESLEQSGIPESIIIDHYSSLINYFLEVVKNGEVAYPAAISRLSDIVNPKQFIVGTSESYGSPAVITVDLDFITDHMPLDEMINEKRLLGGLYKDLNMIGMQISQWSDGQNPSYSQLTKNYRELLMTIINTSVPNVTDEAKDKFKLLHDNMLS